MPPTVELSNETYDKLEKMAVGFDTPENVIIRLIEAQTLNQSAEAIKMAPQDPRTFVEIAFEKFLKKSTRPFGQNAGKWVGASDNNKGVQWNISMNRNSGLTHLGVNLEGMKYKNWPIANLLLTEKKSPELPRFADIDNACEIKVRLTRDAWQAAARPQIRERSIDGNGIKLCELTPARWKTMVKQALECLNPIVDYKGRGRMKVTLLKSGEVVTREVSPHLAFHVTIWEEQPGSAEEAVELISSAYDKLLPLYDWVESRSR